MTALKLSGKNRAFLRSMAHDLNPLVQVGTGGVTDGVVEAVNIALEEHELIKIRLGQNFEGDKKEAAAKLSEANSADLTQIIGRIIVLYRPRDKDLPNRPRIELPREPK